MLIFWTAIHTENIGITRELYEEDPIIISVLKNLRTIGEIDIQMKRD